MTDFSFVFVFPFLLGHQENSKRRFVSLALLLIITPDIYNKKWKLKGLHFLVDNEKTCLEKQIKLRRQQQNRNKFIHFIKRFVVLAINLFIILLVNLDYKTNYGKIIALWWTLCITMTQSSLKLHLIQKIKQLTFSFKSFKGSSQ